MVHKGAIGIALFYGIHPFFRTGQLSELDGIADGGIALTAFAKFQYVDMSEKEREELTQRLKKYCELDTLAMVMVYEHFREIV